MLSKIKITTIIGAKPQFINAATVSKVISTYTYNGEEALVKENLGWVLMYGDTDSTLAGALVAAGANLIAGNDKESIVEAFQKMKDKTIETKRFYGDRNSAMQIVSVLMSKQVSKL